MPARSSGRAWTPTLGDPINDPELGTTALRFSLSGADKVVRLFCQDKFELIDVLVSGRVPGDAFGAASPGLYVAAIERAPYLSPRR